MIARGTLYIQATIILILTLAIASCSVTPDVPVSSIVMSDHFRNQETHSATQQRVDWWQQFNDPALSQLIEKAASHNYDIRIAVERAKQARSGLTRAESRLYPTVDLTGSYSNSETGLPTEIKQINPDTESRRIAFEVGWELDIFGSARAAFNAEKNQAHAARYGVAAAQLIAISDVAQQYFIWQGAQQRFTLLSALFAIQTETEALVQLRYNEGLASALALSQAKADTYNILATLQPLKKRVAATESRIAILIGQSPSLPVRELEIVVELWANMPSFNSGQPADLLLRRPDVLAAEQQLYAESARLVEAKANRFPKLFLSAVFGQQDLTLNNSINLSPSHYTNVAAAFVMPLFNAGQTQAGIEAQTSKQNETLLNYDHTVLRAIGDVETCLSTLQYQQQQTTALLAETQQRQKTVKRAQLLLAEGQFSRLQLNEIQGRLIRTQLSLLESQAVSAVDIISLYKALGGGWQSLTLPESKASSETLGESHE
jgi:NodT family efflux transporter outer membrane factor (OMF) lipoprotein